MIEAALLCEVGGLFFINFVLKPPLLFLSITRICYNLIIINWRNIMVIKRILTKFLIMILSVLFLNSGCSTGKKENYNFNIHALPIGDFNVYVGHIHNHSGIGGGKGTPEQAFEYARDVARMDFLGLAEHSELTRLAEWNSLGEIVSQYTKTNRFIAIRGFEWTTPIYGHLTVLDTNDYRSALDLDADNFDKICSWIVANNGIAFFNHPIYKQIPQEFNHFTSPAPIENIVGMELWNHSRGFNIHYYNDGYYLGDGKNVFDEAILRGWHIGASGSGDDHLAEWGTAQPFRHAVLANSLTRDEILNAFNERRFYSTLDYNLSLSFKINGQEMGSRINPGNYNLQILANDGNLEIFTQITLVKNGVDTKTWTPNSNQPNITDTIDTNSGDYYYIRIKQTDGDEAISSPIWIN
jgi:hypothetical protein